MAGPPGKAHAAFAEPVEAPVPSCDPGRETPGTGSSRRSSAERGFIVSDERFGV